MQMVGDKVRFFRSEESVLTSPLAPFLPPACFPAFRHATITAQPPPPATMRC
eukprot:m.378087 g.378087  ORF g.378087 m.378087 type:complete len:52 (-) comp91306_c0_seq1:26-181(-)